MSNRILNPLAKELVEGKAKIADRSNWCTGIYQDKYGRMCAYGAIGIHNSRVTDASRLLCQVALELYRETIITVNDTRGHEAVMRVYDEAIRRAMNDTTGEYNGIW